MKDDEKLAWLALLYAPNIGVKARNELLGICPDPQQLLRKPPSVAPEALRNYARQPDWQRAEQDLTCLQQHNGELVTITQENYPELLHHLHDPPSVLFTHGNPDLLHMPQLAIVGSRHASRGGIETTQQFAHYLAQHSISITSGLAQGIDSAAHQGALNAGGNTIAVLGTGLDRVYPANNRELAHQIAQHGLLVTEYLPGSKPAAGHFPRRNRIIAALTSGVLVVEAALKSGSLITARLANELGREVFAIPGSIHNPLARGCHALIRDGAKLVETAEHVMEELATQFTGLLAQASYAPNPSDKPTEQDPDHQELLDIMGFNPISTDQLVTISRFNAAEISSMLLLLELQGHVSSLPGGLFTRVKQAAQFLSH
jgi:DNA processing protein